MDDTVGVVTATGSTVLLTRQQTSLSRFVNALLAKDKTCRSVKAPGGVSDESMRLVESYLLHHNGAEPSPVDKPLRSFDMRLVCADPWDADFVDGLKRDQCFDLLNAAELLDIGSLFTLVAAKIASLAKGFSVAEVQEQWSGLDVPTKVAREKREQERADKLKADEERIARTTADIKKKVEKEKASSPRKPSPVPTPGASPGKQKSPPRSPQSPAKRARTI